MADDRFLAPGVKPILGALHSVLGGGRALPLHRPVLSSFPGEPAAPATRDTTSPFRSSQPEEALSTRGPSPQRPETRAPDSKGPEVGPGEQWALWCYGRHHGGTCSPLDHCWRPRDKNPSWHPRRGWQEEPPQERGLCRGHQGCGGAGAALGPGRTPVAGVGDGKLRSAAPGLGWEDTGCSQDVWLAARWTPHL